MSKTPYLDKQPEAGKQGCYIVAKELWTKMYPDRTPWDKLDEATQLEWAELACVGFDVYVRKIGEILDALKKL